MPKYDFPTWMDDVVRCPLLTNDTATGNHSQAFFHQFISSLLSGYPEGTGLESNSSTPGELKDTSGYPYPSTTTLYIIVSAQCLIFAILIMLRYHGVTLYKADEDSLRVRRVRARSQTGTNNGWWIAFFMSKSFEVALGAIALQVHYLCNNKEASRVVTLISRALLGTSCMILTFALNYQRIHRHKDYRQAAVSQTLLAQTRRMNYAVGGLFVLCIVGEFVASHVVVKGKSATVLFWIYISVMITMMLPALLAAAWVCLHQAEIMPTFQARLLLFIAMAVYFLTMFPPSFFNHHAFYDFTHDHPCPFKVLSFFDLTLILNMIAFWLEALEAQSPNVGIGPTVFSLFAQLLRCGVGPAASSACSCCCCCCWSPFLCFCSAVASDACTALGGRRSMGGRDGPPPPPFAASRLGRWSTGRGSGDMPMPHSSLNFLSCCSMPPPSLLKPPWKYSPSVVLLLYRSHDCRSIASAAASSRACSSARRACRHSMASLNAAIVSGRTILERSAKQSWKLLCSGTWPSGLKHCRVWNVCVTVSTLSTGTHRVNGVCSFSSSPFVFFFCPHAATSPSPSVLPFAFPPSSSSSSCLCCHRRRASSFSIFTFRKCRYASCPSLSLYNSWNIGPFGNSAPPEAAPARLVSSCC